MIIKTFQGGFDKNLSYLIWCEKTKIAAIIDPAVEINPILEEINKNNLQLSKIFITHTHHDHIAFLDDFYYLFPNIQILVHSKLKGDYYNIQIEHNQIITVGEELIICLYTPGHYYDSICFWNKKNKSLFTGDTMFIGRTGRTVSARSNIKDLYNSIYNIILKLPHNTTIFPGHHYGYKISATINENIICSKFFNAKSLNEFQEVMNQYELNR